MKNSYERIIILVYDWLAKPWNEMCKKNKLSRCDATRYLIAKNMLEGGIKEDHKKIEETYYKCRKKLEKE